MEFQVKISFINPQIKEGQAKSVAVLPVFKGAKPSDAYKTYDKLSKKRVSAAAKAGQVDGRTGKSTEILGPDGTKTNRLYVTGCGKRDEFNAELFGARVTKALLTCGETTLVIHLDGYGLSPTDAAQAALGAVLASYRFDKYRTTLAADKKPSLKSVKIAIENPAKARAAWNNFYGPVGEGTLIARDLVMEPANKLYPVSYAKRIKKMETLGLKVQILGEAAMKKLGMDALLGVGQGSPRASQLVIMKWDGG